MTGVKVDFHLTAELVQLGGFGVGGQVLEFIHGVQLGKLILHTFRRVQDGIFLFVVDQFHRCGVVNLGVTLDALQLCIVSQRQYHQENNCQHSTGTDKGGTAAALALVLIGQRTEQGQQEQGENIVQCHNNAGGGLTQTEFAGQGHCNGDVVDLPECADQKKSEANQNGAFGVQLHGETSIISFIGYSRCITVHYSFFAKKVQRLSQILCKVCARNSWMLRWTMTFGG